MTAQSICYHPCSPAPIRSGARCWFVRTSLPKRCNLATHLLVLDRGRLAFSGENREEFKTSPQNFYQRVLVTEFLRQAATIAAKDLRAEFRNKEVLNAAFSFSLVVLLLFSFTFDPISNPDMRVMAGGLLWTVYLFSGVLVLNRSFARETANDCLDALVASPLPGSALFLGKCFANSVLLLIAGGDFPADFRNFLRRALDGELFRNCC